MNIGRTHVLSRRGDRHGAVSGWLRPFVGEPVTPFPEHLYQLARGPEVLRPK